MRGDFAFDFSAEPLEARIDRVGQSESIPPEFLSREFVVEGKNYVSPSVTTLLAGRQLSTMENGQIPSLEILTKREKQILVLIAKGMANKNIAAELEISIHTVENHRANLSDKLGLKNTAALVKYAIAKCLV